MDAADRQEKIEFILDHFDDPRNYGSLDPNDILQNFGNPGCGDVVTLYLKLDENERIEKVSFKGDGCTISQASASIMTEIIQGKTLSEIEELPPTTIIDIIGKELAMTRPRCASLGLDAAKLAVQSYRRKKMMEEIENDQ